MIGMNNTAKRRIVIVENQLYEFKLIIANMAKYDYYPSVDEFKDFLDNIEIFLNPRYPTTKQDSAREYIFQKLRYLKPEMFILDYILVGNHRGLTGVDLGLELAKEFKVPIIFLSHTESNKDYIKEGLEKFTDVKATWLPKGFSGVPLLDKTYFF